MTTRTMARERAMHGAFTLIELLLVLVILTVLAAIVVPKFTGRGEEAKVKAAMTQIGLLENALNLFESDHQRFPTGEEGLRVLAEDPGNLSDWHDLMKSIPLDPWGNPYQYQQPGTHNVRSFDLYSLGPDGKPGTDDITNW